MHQSLGQWFSNQPHFPDSANKVLNGQATQRKLGLGLRISIDYSDYSLEHIKENHGERPWIGYV